MNRRLLILTYHAVSADPDELRPAQTHAVAFEHHMRTLRRYRFNVLPLRAAFSRLSDGTLPPRAVSITFDDGYTNNLEVAAPILARYGFPAVVFVASGFLNGGLMWNDVIIESIRRTSLDAASFEFPDLTSVPLGDLASRRQAMRSLITAVKYLPDDERASAAAEVASRLRVGSLPDNLMMNANQLGKLGDFGIEVGGHTVNHPILKRIPQERAKAEIRECRLALEDAVDSDVLAFAYPNGVPGRDYESEHVTAVRDAGFELAVTTAWSAARASDDRFQLPRIGLANSTGGLPDCLRLIRTYWHAAADRVTGPAA